MFQAFESFKKIPRYYKLHNISLLPSLIVHLLCTVYIECTIDKDNIIARFNGYSKWFPVDKLSYFFSRD